MRRLSAEKHGQFRRYGVFHSQSAINRRGRRGIGRLVRKQVFHDLCQSEIGVGVLSGAGECAWTESVD